MYIHTETMTVTFVLKTEITPVRTFLHSLSQFVKDCTGTDLEGILIKGAQDVYTQILKKSANKVEKINVKLNQQNLHAIQTGTLKMKTIRAPTGAV